jgi:hypothetical protein
MNRTSTTPSPHRGLVLGLAVVALFGLSLIVNGGVGAGAAPSGSVSAGGPTGQTLTVTPALGLDPGGAVIDVSGTGYDTSFGIYVAFCVDQGPALAPSPCVGGIDMTGTGGSAKWISSNPPPYGVGLAIPYGPGGTFDVELTISAQDTNVNCLDGVTVCRVVTRADHLNAGNRTADVKVPVTFGTPSGPTSSTSSTTSTAPPTTQAPIEGPNGERTGTGPNGQRVTVAPANDLDPAGATLRVTGTGFDPSVGIYVAFCVDQGPSVAPSPCFGGADQSGSTGASKWISSNPPPYGVGLTTPWGPGGSFDVELNITAQEGSVDCLDGSTRCVVATRADHTAAGNRSADVKVPVFFEGQIPSNALPITASAPRASTAPRFTG